MAASDTIAKLLEPVRNELDRIELELGELDAKRHALIDERRKLAAIVRAASGPNGRPGPRARATPAPNAERIELVRSYFPAGEDFNSTMLERAMKEAGERVTLDTIRRVLTYAHEAGEIRFLRTGTAGTKWYRVIGSDDG